MRSRPTVLVLGAGASKEFGLPLGAELKGQIARDLDIKYEYGVRLISGSHEIAEALQRLVRQENGRDGNINLHRDCAVKISGAMRLSGSIDEYAERHRDNSRVADCAKLAISKAIIEAERRSKLFQNPRNPRQDLISDASESWLAYLLRDLTRGLTTPDLKRAFDNIYIINFNYDRCVEQFIFLWLQQVYGLDQGQSAEIAGELKIFHPYGHLGALPHQNPSSHIPFGGEYNSLYLVNMANGIRTYSEATEESLELSVARQSLAMAEKIVFLGFAFHTQNMDLIRVPKGTLRSSLRCYATTWGISHPRLDLDKSKMVEVFGLNSSSGLFLSVTPGTCEDFWSEYGDVVIQ